MDGKMIIELIGYLGSALVVVSMLMTSVIRLRIVNTVGSVIFMCYALVIGSYPTALMNLCLVAINVYHLFRLMKGEKHYKLIPVDLRDGYLSFFIEENLSEIRKWFPDFSAEGLDADIVYLVCCDSHPAGLFIGRKIDGCEAEILLDYATPVYRDTSVGRFLYGQLKGKGCKTLVFRKNAPEHAAYMEKVGYRKNERGEYVLRLDEMPG